MRKILSFVFLSIIVSSVIFVLESSDIRATFGITANPNCALVTKGVNLHGFDLSNCDLSDYDLLGANLSGANLSIANLGGANLQGANLSGANLAGANLAGANLNKANLAGANLKGAILTNSILISTNLGTITIQTLASSLVSGSAYTISPDPKTGLGSLTITDGGPGDEDGTNDGMIKIPQIPKGRYVISQVSVPPGFLSLLGSTTININPSDLDQNVTFQVISTSTDLATLPPTPITSPSLSNSTFNQWTRLFSAIIVNNVNSSPINNVAQTPQVIVVGRQNPTAIDTAINSQSSVLLNASFA